PIADQEEDERKWRLPFVSANDGGSGVALLMELGNHMKDLPTQVGVDFVFFDGEEYIWQKGDDYFFGSRYFAETYRKERGKQRYAAAVLFDMIAGKDPHFAIEANSWLGAAEVVKELWQIAADLKCNAFQATEGDDVLDDHIALNRVGIHAVDIIDMKGYQKHW